MTSLCKLLKINYFTSQLAIGWEPDLNKNQLAKKICTEMNELLPKNSPAKLSYTLGGCEASKIINSKCTNFSDGILWAPTIEHLHSPSERVNIKSVQRCFKALCEVIKKLG
jgi:dipeptidase D